MTQPNVSVHGTVGAAPPATLPTVLVVEDDSMLLRVAARVLRQQGLEVVCASNGREALRVARRLVGPPAAVLTAAELPDTDVPGMVAQLRSLHPRAAVPVVVMSSQELEAMGRKGMAPLQVLPKPITAGGLAHTVSAAIEAGAA